MDLVRSGEIFNFKVFQSPRAQIISGDISDSSPNCRFQDLFLESPRAQELVATMETSRCSLSTSSLHQLHNNSTENEGIQGYSNRSIENNSGIRKSGVVVNMADFFKVGIRKPDKDSGMTFSPCKVDDNENILKIHVSEVINRLDSSICSDATNRMDSSPKQAFLGKGFTFESADSGFNDAQSDSGRNSLGELTASQELRLQYSEVNYDVDVEGELNNIGPDCNDGPTGNEASSTNAKRNKSQKEQDEHYPSPNNELMHSVDGNNKQAQADDKLSIHREPVSSKPIPQANDSSNYHRLHGWHIKALKSRTHYGIIVEGQRQEDPEGELWHSTVIVSRVNSKLVETRSKSQYHLMGPLEEKIALQFGFSKKFVAAFKNGFPPNWEQRVKEHFASIQSFDSDNEKEQKNSVRRQSRSGGKQKQWKTKPQPANSGGKLTTPLNTRSQNAKKTNKNGFQCPVEVELQVEIVDTNGQLFPFVEDERDWHPSENYTAT